MEPISFKIWTPDATSLTDTPEAQNQADNANKLPTVDDAAKQFEVTRPVADAEPSPEQVAWEGDVKNLWNFFNDVKDYFAIKYGTNPGLNTIQSDNRLIAQQQAQYTNTNVAESLFTFA